MQSRSFIFSYFEQNFENNKGQYDPPNLAHLLICSIGRKGFLWKRFAHALLAWKHDFETICWQIDGDATNPGCHISAIFEHPKSWPSASGCWLWQLSSRSPISNQFCVAIARLEPSRTLSNPLEPSRTGLRWVSRTLSNPLEPSRTLSSRSENFASTIANTLESTDAAKIRSSHQRNTSDLLSSAGHQTICFLIILHVVNMCRQAVSDRELGCVRIALPSSSLSVHPSSFLPFSFQWGFWGAY